MKASPQEESLHLRLPKLARLGSISAFLLLTLFLIGLTGIASAENKWSFLQDNWLMILFKINASFQHTSADRLNLLNLVDLVILVLFGLLFLSLYVALHRTSRIWSVIAACLPFMGLVLFLITRTAGRSALLVGGLIFSILMLWNPSFNKACATTGIVGSTLLFFIGDLGTAFLPPSDVIAVLIAIGYLLWMAWFFLIGLSLFFGRIGIHKEPI